MLCQLTLSSNWDHTRFRSESYSPFFLIVCSKPSMDDRCVEVNGSSEALNLLRGSSAGSSSLCLLAIASSVAALDDAFKLIGLDPPCSSMNVGGSRNLCSTEVHELFMPRCAQNLPDISRFSDLPTSSHRAAHEQNIDLKHVLQRFELPLRASPIVSPTEKLATSSQSHLDYPLITMMSKILFWSGFGTCSPSSLLFPRAF